MAAFVPRTTSLPAPTPVFTAARPAKSVVSTVRSTTVSVEQADSAVVAMATGTTRSVIIGQFP